MSYTSVSKQKNVAEKPSSTGYISLSKLKQEQLGNEDTNNEQLPSIGSGYVSVSKLKQTQPNNLPIGYNSSPDVIDVSNNGTDTPAPKKSILSRFMTNFLSPTLGNSGKTMKEKLDESDAFIDPHIQKAMEFHVGEGLTMDQTDNAFKAILKSDVSQNPSFMSKGYYDPIAPSFSNKISTSQNILLSSRSTPEEKQQAMEELSSPAIGASTGIYRVGGRSVNIPKNVFKYFAREKNPAVLEQDLIKIGLDEQNSKALSRELAETKTPKQAKEVVGNFKDITVNASENPYVNILKGEVKPPSDIVPMASNALPSVEQRVVNITGEAPQPVPFTIEEKANTLAGIENKPATSKELPKTSKLEEEVTTEPITVYRGEGEGIGNSTLVKGQYLADTKDFAKNFGEVTEETIPAGSKVFNLDAVKTGEGSIPQEMLVDKDKLTSYLIDNGFDYTKNTNTRGVEYVKLNKTLNELENLARDSKSLADFKKRVMESYDYYRGELARISKDYSVADHSRMRSPMEDVYNRVNKLKIPKTGEVVFDRTTKEIEAGLERVFGRKIPMREVFNAEKELGNKNAVGRAFKSGIRLLKENNSLSEAVANHEGYHWAKMNMPAEDAQRLNKLEEQLKLARPKEAQIIRELGYSEDQIAEEMVANEFAKFYQTGKTTFAKLRIFFEKMLQKLKMIFGKRGKLLKEFSDIKTTVAKEGERAPPKARFEKRKEVQDYAMSHRPSESGAIASDITKNGEYIPKDFYEHPEYYSQIKNQGDYGNATRESFAVLQKIKGKPEAEVTIYRASPSKELNNGDWVTLSKKYAEIHAKDSMPVNSYKVKAKDIQFAGDDINEFGYYPTKKQVPSKLKMGEASQIDRLIAEGKIRVVSRDGKDVYQVKKGGNWINAQSEDSAVMMANPKPKVEKELPKELDDQKNYIEIMKETIAQDPAQALLKYYDYKLGGLPEVGKNMNEIGNNRKVSKWRLSGDEIAMDLGYENSDQAREAVDKLILRKRELRAIEKDFRKNKIQLEENQREVKKISIQKILEEKVISSVKEASIPRIDTVQGEGRSLEIIAEQAQREANGIGSEDILPLPKIVIDTSTSVKNKINILDLFRTPDRVLTKFGFGSQAKKAEKAYIEYVKELPKNIEKVTQWLKRIPDPKGQLAIFRWLDGKAVTLGPKELEVAVEIKTWLKEWAERLGLPVDEQITHYVTHIFSNEIIEKEFPEDLAKLISDKIPRETFNPFLLERLGIKGYKEDLGAALDAYVKRATRKVHMDPVLKEIQAKAGSSLEFSNLEASQYKYIQKYISGIQMRPTEIDNIIDNTVKSIIGYKFGQRPLTRAMRFLRQMTYRGMLGLNPGSALRNLSQGMNTFAILGPKYTTIGYAKLFNKGAIKELQEEGILNTGFVQDRVMSATRKNIERMDKVLFSFFDTAEKINRGATYWAAKTKFLNQRIKKLDGVEISDIDNLEEKAREYAREMVRKTQFSFSPTNTPVGLQSDIIKTATQFSAFSIKQTEFLIEMMKDRNFVGLFRYALFGTLFVALIGRIFGMKPDELIPFYSTFSRGETPFGATPSLNLPKELFKASFNISDKYGNERSTEKKLQDIGKATLGVIPTGSQMRKTFQGIQAINEGGSFSANGKLQFAGPKTKWKKFQAVVFGKNVSQEAQDYFKKEEINQKEYEKIKPVYEEAQRIKKIGEKEGKEAEAVEEAKVFVNTTLETPEDRALYKKYKTIQTTKETLQGKKDILPFYLEMQELKKTNLEEAKRLLKSKTKEEQKYYSLVKKQFEKDQKASGGEIPSYENNEPQTEKGLVNTVSTYAKAISVSPITAFNRIFTGQRIRRVDNGAIIVERMPLADSVKVKKERGSSGNMKLDHNIPLQLGGSNSGDNLVLVEDVLWKSYTPVENFLGKKLREKKITKEKAQELIKKFKSAEISAEDVYNYK